MKFPNDADGQVLKTLYNEGINFKKPHNVDFFIAVPNKKKGEMVLEVLKNNGYNAQLEQDDETDEWTCYCSKKMQLKHGELVAMQKKLDDLCRPYEGQADGWGIMVD
ncbi:ribonuclease E inhibitor RraB [Jeotgalibacillus soli]|uniref:Regulator of ribonuclease activity B domain-containing protein n=1 Tax=Jeotgalibacillus soli TaxID=889306 RepID=A0A0C2V7V9_9BACL|nr:ribonuclease E inhibitor RraB [Jeotgalibacillus soli]KIL45032.1 hypothetical protein KP78_25760 [Jeotgalibacillus soli]